MQDTLRDKGLRKKLIDKLREKGISNQAVLEAMQRVPRHFFMDSSFLSYAYKDQAFPISSGQTISQPYTVAFQSSLLNLKPGDKVLEIGTGSGYQCAILIELGAIAYSIERYKDLYLSAGKLLSQMGYRPNLFWGDGYKGLPGYAPFNKILLTAGASYIPDDLIAQLKIGGNLIAPIGQGKIQTMTLLTKISETEITTEDHGSFSFVPFLPGKI